MEQFYAHTPVKDGPWHALVSHLKQTAVLAKRNADKFGAGELARVAGLWHDVGKFNPKFQRVIIDRVAPRSRGRARIGTGA